MQITVIWMKYNEFDLAQTRVTCKNKQTNVFNTFCVRRDELNNNVLENVLDF